MSSQPDQSGVAIVTGAATGIGKAIALALLAHGWKVAFSGRRKEALIHARKSISYAPTEARRYVLWGLCALPPSCLSFFRSLRRGARSLLLRATTTR